MPIYGKPLPTHIIRAETNIRNVTNEPFSKRTNLINKYSKLNKILRTKFLEILRI